MAMNPYEELEVERGATLAEIKRAYRRMAMIWHPDRYQYRDKNDDKNGGDFDPEYVETKFKRITEAYHILSDATRRKEYDETGRTSEKDSDRPMQIVRAMLLSVISDPNFNPRHHDLFKEIEKKILHVQSRMHEEAMAMEGQQIGVIEARIGKYREVLDRMESTERLASIVQHQIDTANEEIETIRSQIRAKREELQDGAEALNIIRNYKYRVDEIMGHIGGQLKVHFEDPNHPGHMMNDSGFFDGMTPDDVADHLRRMGL